MKKLIKLITCLCMGVFADSATAETIVFNGCNNTPNNYLRFFSGDSPNKIGRVEINERFRIKVSKFDKEQEITLIIPAEVEGKQVSLDPGAFGNFDSEILRIKVKFQPINKIAKIKKKSRRYKNGIGEKYVSRKVFVKFPNDCSYLFGEATAITEIDLYGMDPKLAVQNARSMFGGCNNLKKIKHLGKFKTNNVKDMSEMFSRCHELQDLDLSSFNTQNAEDMRYMFYRCKKLNKLNLKEFNTRNVKNMSGMFYECAKLSTLNLKNFDTRNVESMDAMFAWCKGLRNINFGNNFYTDNVTDMYLMFCQCHSLTLLNLKGFNTRNVRNMCGMFSHCVNLRDINFGDNFYTDNVTNMSTMFWECRSLTRLECSHFNTSNVTNMKGMFENCRSLQYCNLTGFNTAKVSDMQRMFKGCQNLSQFPRIKVKPGGEATVDMFKGNINSLFPDA